MHGSHIYCSVHCMQHMQNFLKGSCLATSCSYVELYRSVISIWAAVSFLLA